MAAGEEQKAEGDAKKRREREPAGAAEMDMFPVLRDNDGGDGDRQQNGKRGGHVQWNKKSEQGNGDERLAEAERRSNQCGCENDD